MQNQNLTNEDAPQSPVQSSKSDAELAQAAAGGNMESFEELYRRHFHRVYALTLRMTGNVTEAEDLTQEVFTNLFRKIGSFRGESAFTTWLHRMTVNIVLMSFRKRQSRPELIPEDDETVEEIVAGAGAQKPISMIDRISLEGAIAKLSPGYRTVFVLHDIEGYEHEEIAEMLGISVGTSKSQLHRARLKLRELVRERTPNA